ncbi:hypothetical protein ACS0TY_002576 [Phlomoides rotata]
MGVCASKPPPKPNPYARRDASSERSEPTQNTPPHPKTLLEEGDEGVVKLDKSFGLSNKFGSSFEIGEEVGPGHFGYSCSAIGKKGELKAQKVAVKIIPKSKMTTAIAIEDVRREIKILRALTGHPNLVQFYDAFEDADNVYIVMELCEGGELLDWILTRVGKFSEDDAKTIIVQILNVVALCHLQGVVHRDIKPENFLFTSKHEYFRLKAVDFGLSDFVRPDQKLKEIVGSAYYVAPEVLLGSYGTEADIWSVGVIAYILLCGVFQPLLKTNPSFDENPWPTLSSESKDFVRCLLREDPRRRITAAQALCHPWLRNHDNLILPLDIHIFRPMKAYMRSSTLRRAALRALSKTLTVNELFYLKEQFSLMFPDASGGITLDTIKMALIRNAADAARESYILDFLEPLNALGYRKMYLEEFCAAALSVYQLEILDNWEQRTRSAYDIFDKDGNRTILIEELASELGLSPSVSVHAVLQEYVRHSDGNLTFAGFAILLHNQPICSSAKTP